MIQHRVFIPNVVDTYIDITDPNVQSILKTGERVAFLKDDIIYYAISPNQTSWYTLYGIEDSEPVAADETTVLNAKQLTSESGTAYDPFIISKASKTDAKGNSWWVITVKDLCLQHKFVKTSHTDSKSDKPDNTSVKFTVGSGGGTSDAAFDFENILAMIFKAEIYSTNHKRGLMTKTEAKSSDLIRKYSENNLVNYGIHIDQMVCIGDNNNEISFDNLPGGQYKFVIAKIVHPTSTSLADAQKLVVGTHTKSACYLTRALVSKSGLTILNESRTGVDDHSINISVSTKDDISTIYLNVTLEGSGSDNDRWICNASITGYEHTRFATLLADKFHAVVGTSYDCFKSSITIDEYTAANAGAYQERYKVGKLESRGLPYMVRVNIKPNTAYEYTPDFTASSEKSYSLSIDGIEYFRYTSVSSDNKSLIYDAGYDHPEGTLMFAFSDTYNKRDYTANYKIDELATSAFAQGTVEGKSCYVLDIDVIVSRGRANLNSVDGISFVAYAVLPSKYWDNLSAHNDANIDLDSYLMSPSIDEPASETAVQTERRSFNENASSLLGLSLNGDCNAFVGFVEDAINTYCSGDNRGYSMYAISSFPYITIPAEFRQQSSSIYSNIQNMLTSVTISSTYDDINSAVKTLTGDRVDITADEYNALDKTSVTTLKESLAKLVAQKLFDNWNGEIATAELYYFNTGHPRFNNEYNRKAQDKYNFTGGYANIPKYIINSERDFYNLIFTLYRNVKRDDEMGIKITDITTELITFGKSNDSNPDVNVNCPVSLKRRFNGVEYTYKLAHQQEVSARVLTEHAYAFGGYDVETLKDTTPGIFSFLYKIEPEDGKTAGDYPKEDFLLGTVDYPLSIYSPKKQSVGCWLMCHPLLCIKYSSSEPADFASDIITSDSQYYSDTHIIENNGTFYYASAYNIYSTSASSYDALDEAFVKKAKEIGLPLFSIVFFDVKAINPLSVNFRQFLQKSIRDYIEEYLKDPSHAIGDITTTAGTNLLMITCNSSQNQELLATLQKILTDKRGVSGGTDTGTTTATITFAYGNNDYEDFWPTYITDIEKCILYGRYNYNTEPSIDDWEFKFVTE